MLAVAVCAVLTGAKSFVAIEEWVTDAPAGLLQQVGLTRERVAERTLRRVFAVLDADLLDRLLGAWAATRLITVGRRRVYAIDGKTLRGARSKDTAAPHLVAALVHGSGTVTGQSCVDTKTNEIPTAQNLIITMADDIGITDAVITMDAIHTQHQTAKLITHSGADYVLCVKANQKSLHRALKKLPWNNITGHSTTTLGHGRRVTRTIKVIAEVPAWIEFTGATQIAQLRRTVTKNGKKTVEVVYLITSADHEAAPPAVLAAWIQGHWEVEDRLHWVRDVTFDEDRSQTRTGHLPRVMASLRNLVIGLLRLDGWGNIAEATRHHSRYYHRPIDLILTR